jgi:hypothetical protein
VPNAAPVAFDIVHLVHAGSSILATPSASDADGDPVTLVAHGTPSHGTIVWMYADAIHYAPNPGFVGTDSFAYTVGDGQGGFSTAVMTIHVWNTDPTAADATATVRAGQGVWIYPAMGDADGDFVGMVSTTAPTKGSLTMYGDAIYYGANPGEQGIDTITFTVSDGVGGFTTATLTVTVLNDPPIAVEDAFSVDEDSYILSGPMALFLNDVVVDSPQSFWTAQLVTGPAHGTAVVFADGSFAYVPDANWNGTDSFTYRIWNGHDYSNEATVTIAVAAVNDLPQSLGEVVVTDAGTAVTFTPSMIDADGDSPFVSSIVSAIHGTAVLNSNGSITYTPNDPIWTRSDSFSYEVNDGNGGTVTALLVVLVNATPASMAAVPALSETEIAAEITLLGSLMNDIDSEYSAMTGTIANVLFLKNAYTALNTKENWNDAFNNGTSATLDTQINNASAAHIAAYGIANASMMDLSLRHGKLLNRLGELKQMANATSVQIETVDGIISVRPANLYKSAVYRKQLLD